jgi:hypothetical protein
MLANITHTKITEWHSTDQESLFEKNLKTTPEEWIYRSKKIYYNLNSQGYRCPDWGQIDWTNSILLIGCSVTFGVGLAEEDTLSARLSAITGKSVINLGVGSSSNQLMLYNSFKLLDQNIRPSQVIVLFSDVSRVTHFKEGNAVTHFGNWIYPTHSHHNPTSKLSMPKFSDHELNFYSHWIYDSNSDVHGSMSARSIESLWKSHGINFLGCSAYNGQLSDRYYRLPMVVDKARDLMHPGTMTIREWADSIGKRISAA